MSRSRAQRRVGAILGCLVVLALHAFGAQRDAEQQQDDDCWRKHGKTFSHQHRTCIPPQ